MDPTKPGLSQSLRDDDIRRLSHDEVLQRLRWSESERVRLIAEHGNAIKEANRRTQMHLAEIRSLKEANDEIQKQTQELRDLCCFLDDDRQKGRKLAREWQKFGRYSSGVMNSELTSYQDKLKSLEEKQRLVVQENVELKEVILMLDQGRTSKRNSVCSNCSVSLSSEENGPISSGDMQRGSRSQTPVVDDQAKAYINRLEDRIRRLEDEKRHRNAQPLRPNGPLRDDRMPNHVPGPNRASSALPPPYQPRNHGPPPPTHPENGPHSPQPGKRFPDMVNALKVLEVHDHIDKRPASNREDSKQLDDNQKAIVREMCNVVWRKLGDNPSQPPNNTLPNNYHGPPSGHPAPLPRYSTGGPPPTIRQVPPPRSVGSTSSLDKKGL